MFYRRKIILALLQLFDGELDKIKLQKLLFLFTQKQDEKAFDFVPYKFGCYSFSASADLTTMSKKEFVCESETYFKKNDKHDYLKDIRDGDKKQLLEIKQQFGKMDANALMRHTYVNFPYWATKSVKAKNILTSPELQRVKESVRSDNSTILFTIGYEGISLEEYLNRLLQNNIKTLVDVRNNPLSMKFGFSKSQLKRFCENLEIEYLHMPDVGIQSEYRQALNSQQDYDALFEVYREKNLTKTTHTQTQILDLLQKKRRIALTCFEANICQCHRKPLAEAIQHLPGFHYEVKHI